GETLKVDAGWEAAVEGALGQMIEGVLLESPETLVDALAELGEGRLALVAQETGDAAFAATSLAAKVQGPLAIRRMLANLHVAESLGEARHLLPQLGEGASVITPSGERLGAGWLRVLRSGAAKQGALLREREIQSLRGEIDTLHENEGELEQQIAGFRDRALAAEQAREEAQRSLYQSHRAVSELAGQLQSHKGRLDSARGRLANIDNELAQIAQAVAEGEAQTREARDKLETAIERMAALEDGRQALESERHRLSDARNNARERARESRETAHALALTVETQRTQVKSLTQALSRMGQQRGQLDNRLGELSAQLSEGDNPVKALEADRQSALDERVRVDQALASARAALETIESELRGYEQTRQQRDAEALTQREAIGQRKLDQQAAMISANRLSSEISEAGFVLQEVVSGLLEEADASVWERAVIDFDAKLRRLEPVNLAAIAEHAEAEERKTYLDAQDADLNLALETLEDAIKKIDRETRGRFKDTFDRVNAGVQELYPRLFGGGHAYLELTGDDLLDTGVTIMARPPGKRVSSITLLSGGEKAMTAVALVFAIFRLNPAPFCLLDEVDAPLDEANVGRLAAMVKEMSEAVQFLFVTHNKATMEAAEQLSGVTMREPGVSRLVSVDLAEATRMVSGA
ncbi:MAG: chromosome segregation protein SMC, partial [Pseudomonadota bacterium]|nr:chromosome segregation protein SMC [Pseudomonadota bacterium]